jgi:hypothetical protein
VNLLSITLWQSLTECISVLGDYGCPDITEHLDVNSCSSIPLFTGGFGNIYRGKTHDGKLVAIKSLRYTHEALIGTDSSVLKVRKISLKYITLTKRFDQSAAHELYLWSKSKHSNVLELMGLIKFCDHIAMVSPWMENGTVPQYLARRPEADRNQLVSLIHRRDEKVG